jgi:hypothetical protein
MKRIHLAMILMEYGDANLPTWESTRLGEWHGAAIEACGAN